MTRSFSFLSLMLVLALVSPKGFLSREKAKPTLEERLIRLEEGQKSLEKRIEDLRLELTTRFEAVDRQFEAVDKRFEAIDKRFDDLRFWLQFIFGVVVLILDGVFGQWITLVRRVTKLEAREQELKEFRERLAKLEVKLEQAR